MAVYLDVSVLRGFRRRAERDVSSSETDAVVGVGHGQTRLSTREGGGGGVVVVSVVLGSAGLRNGDEYYRPDTDVFWEVTVGEVRQAFGLIYAHCEGKEFNREFSNPLFIRCMVECTINCDISPFIHSFIH